MCPILSLTKLPSVQPGRTVSTEEGERGKEVCVVTGGAGFLGQHITHLLHTTSNDLHQIRTFDIRPFKKILDYKDQVSSQHFQGDITQYDDVIQALDGADVVYHVAGVVSYGTRPNFELMTKVNVKGTQTIIEACRAVNVQRLVFCSTVDVVVGSDDIIDGTEDSTTTPHRFLFPGYPQSKHEAEVLVCRANGSRLANGGQLNTVSLRANVMYGEGDPFLIPSVLQSAQDLGGWAVRIGNGRALCQLSYVGNVAGAFLAANQALRDKDRRPQVGGHFFFVPDDTPSGSIYSFVVPYLSDRGFNPTPIAIPYWFIYGVLKLRDLILLVLSPVVRVNAQPPICSITYINMSITFRNDKARALLGYTPLYSPDQALHRSRNYYKQLKFSGAS
ncbi:3 beta-hydroxysteroid dehydrogenase/Delta 5--_4-isomerase type 4-like isoform X1 [Argonauta hians]